MTTKGHRGPRQWPLLLLLFSFLVTGVQQARMAIVLYLLALICALVAVQTNPPIIYVAMFGLGIFLGSHLLGALYNAYSVTLFERLANILRKLRSNLHREPSGSADATALPTVAEKLKLYALHAIAAVAAERLDRPIKRKIFELHLVASWLYTVTLSMLVYAIEYYALYRVDPDYFKGTDSAGFWQFAKFSFELLTPASFSHIEPTSRIPLLLCYSEVAIGVVILAILVLSILSASREVLRQDAAKFTAELHNTASAIETRISKVYKLSFVQLELSLLIQDGSTVNWIRKFRRLPELPIPATSPIDEIGQRKTS